MIEIEGSKNNKKTNNKKKVAKIATMEYNKKTDTCEPPKFKNGLPKNLKKINETKKYALKGKTCGYILYLENNNGGKKEKPLDFDIYTKDVKQKKDKGDKSDKKSIIQEILTKEEIELFSS